MFESLAPNEAIEKLFELYADDVYRYARYSLPPTEDARDTVQEVFMRAFRSWHTFRHDSNPQTWILHITKNYIFDVLRKKRTERKHQISGAPDFSEVTVSMETLIDLEEALSLLKDNHRQVILLRSIQGMTVDETAEILGWSTAKVKTTHHRAIKSLREVLDSNTKEGERIEYRGTDSKTVGTTVTGKAKRERQTRNAEPTPPADGSGERDDG